MFLTLITLVAKIFSENNFICLQTSVKSDLSLEEMQREISNFSQEDHSAGDMCVMAIMSHGDKGLIFSSDGKALEEDWILEHFNNRSCPSLMGKPKLFMFLACR